MSSQRLELRWIEDGEAAALCVCLCVFVCVCVPILPATSVFFRSSSFRRRSAVGIRNGEGSRLGCPTTSVFYNLRFLLLQGKGSFITVGKTNVRT
jgi:hypothetical protein